MRGPPMFAQLASTKASAPRPKASETMPGRIAAVSASRRQPPPTAPPPFCRRPAYCLPAACRCRHARSPWVQAASEAPWPPSPPQTMPGWIPTWTHVSGAGTAGGKRHQARATGHASSTARRTNSFPPLIYLPAVLTYGLSTEYLKSTRESEAKRKAPDADRSLYRCVQSTSKEWLGWASVRHRAALAGRPA